MLQWLEITFGCKLNSENIVLSNYQSTARAQTSAKTSSPQSGIRTRDNHPDDEAFSALTALCVTACTAALLRGKLAAFCYGFSFFLVMQVCESSLLFRGQNGCFSQVTACCLLCEEFCANTVSALEHSRDQLCFLLIFINRVSGLSYETPSCLSPLTCVGETCGQYVSIFMYAAPWGVSSLMGHFQELD